MMKKLPLAIMLFGFLGLLLGVNPAGSQTACGPAFVGNPDFCNIFKTEAAVPPSPAVTDRQKPPKPTIGYPARFAFLFLCSDAFDGHLLDCGYSVEIVKPIDSSPTVPSAENGGHIASAHGSSHPLTEPKDGDLIFSGFPGSSGTVASFPPDPPKMIGKTGQNVAVVLYPVPQASGDLLIEQFITMPPRYLCGSPGCFDQVPGRFGLNRMQFLTTLHVGIPIEPPTCPFCPVTAAPFPELIQTPDTPFVLSQGPTQLAAHPANHFGTAAAIELIRQIALAYREQNARLGKLGINDISLVRGGVYDLNKQWFGDNAGNPHWGHRTGTEVDIDTTDSLMNNTACTSIRGGNNRVEKAATAVIREFLIPTVPQGSIPFTDQPISAYLCESEGRNHVYLQ